MPVPCNCKQSCNICETVILFYIRGHSFLQHLNHAETMNCHRIHMHHKISVRKVNISSSFVPFRHRKLFFFKISSSSLPSPSFLPPSVPCTAAFPNCSSLAVIFMKYEKSTAAGAVKWKFHPEQQCSLEGHLWVTEIEQKKKCRLGWIVACGEQC